jgi:hypothetical protein
LSAVEMIRSEESKGNACDIVHRPDVPPLLAARMLVWPLPSTASKLDNVDPVIWRRRTVDVVESI